MADRPWRVEMGEPTLTPRADGGVDVSWPYHLVADQLLRCAYCGLVHPEAEDDPPAPDDDGGWKERAIAHDRDCPWVKERMQRPASGG